MTAERTDSPNGQDLSYVYAVVPKDIALTHVVDGLRGVDDRAVRLVSEGAVAALVSSVPADTFGEQGLKAQMEDLSRLESIARAHHAVVGAAFAAGTVLPMRLATVYLDDARVCALLRERLPEFEALLDRLDQHVELGVKVYAEAGGTESAEPLPPTGAAGTGRAYLQQRRAQRRSSQDVYRRAAAVAEEVVHGAAGLAAARVVHRPQQGELAAAAGTNIANEAYLVPAASIDRFRAVLDALVRDSTDVRIDITGPWAPYSFATLTAEEGTARG
ncbi:GvpL/GvpF family gas vesicle protein [Streptomyces sp. NPDC019396]|uniref:GvpL/GvpF family gas vesicle protein n=1 Tax=Streptomyces sp. NPDC019396 TaxID=3154687 RepID=UPI0034076F16